MKRPLTGEPLAVDLINTRWRQDGHEVDALATLDGLADWLRERDLPDVPVTGPVRDALVHTRAALRDVVDGVPDAEERLNAVLARGLAVRSLLDGQVQVRVLFTDDSWGPAWRAAEDYLTLRADGPDRIRRCEHPTCVLYFYDPTGRRRWCSMAGCGNRAKAQRHHARRRAEVHVVQAP